MSLGAAFEAVFMPGAQLIHSGPFLIQGVGPWRVLCGYKKQMAGLGGPPGPEPALGHRPSAQRPQRVGYRVGWRVGLGQFLGGWLNRQEPRAGGRNPRAKKSQRPPVPVIVGGALPRHRAE